MSKFFLNAIHEKKAYILNFPFKKIICKLDKEIRVKRTSASLNNIECRQNCTKFVIHINNN